VRDALIRDGTTNYVAFLVHAEIVSIDLSSGTAAGNTAVMTAKTHVRRSNPKPSNKGRSVKSRCFDAPLSRRRAIHLIDAEMIKDPGGPFPTMSRF
jgi:hypothetical protein